MAEWRRLTAADVQSILQAFGLPGYRSHRPIAVGTINTNIRVETDARPLFLRINEGKSQGDVAREADIVSWVAARGVPTPEPRRTAEGQPFAAWQGQLASLFPWVAGRTLARAELTPAHGAAAGRALAQLHLAGAAHPDRRAGRYEPEEIDRRLVTVAALAQPELAAAVGDPATRVARAGRRAPPAAAAAGSSTAICSSTTCSSTTTARSRRCWTSSRRRGDAGPTTWPSRCWPSGSARTTFAPTSPARCWTLTPRSGPPSADERAGFGAELRFAACRFAVTRITDVHLKRASGAAPGKRFQRYLDRLARIKHHLASDTLLAL